MTVIELPVQIKTPDLFKVIEQLAPAELDDLVKYAQVLQKKKQNDSELLTIINRQLPTEQQLRLHELSAKQELETITEHERKELLRLTDKIESADVERSEALLALAQRRNLSLRQLLHQLNLDQNFG